MRDTEGLVLELHGTLIVGIGFDKITVQEGLVIISDLETATIGKGSALEGGTPKK